MDCGHQFHRLSYKIKYQQFIKEEHTQILCGLTRCINPWEQRCIGSQLDPIIRSLCH